MAVCCICAKTPDEHLAVDYLDEVERCEYCACGAVKSCIQMLDDCVLMCDRYVHVSSVCYATRLEWGLLLSRDLSDNNDLVMPSSGFANAGARPRLEACTCRHDRMSFDICTWTT